MEKTILNFHFDYWNPSLTLDAMMRVFQFVRNNKILGVCGLNILNILNIWKHLNLTGGRGCPSPAVENLYLPGKCEREVNKTTVFFSTWNNQIVLLVQNCRDEKWHQFGCKFEFDLRYRGAQTILEKVRLLIEDVSSWVL